MKNYRIEKDRKMNIKIIQKFMKNCSKGKDRKKSAYKKSKYKNHSEINEKVVELKKRQKNLCI